MSQPGRSFPTAREAWSLIAGGLHPRADRNRRPDAKTNVRLAVLLGISICLSFQFCCYIVPTLGLLPGSNGVSWLWNTTGAVGLAAAFAPWLGGLATTTALIIPAGALVAYGELSQGHRIGTVMSLAGVVPLAVLVVCWLVTDARPAFALCLSILLADVVTFLPGVIWAGGGWLMVTAELQALLPQFAVVLPVILAAWLFLRRQEAPSPRPFVEP